ncbi:hypothetical protein Bca101_043848 [Brassica carinata]
MPCKADTGDERQRQRKANFDAALVKLKEGNVKAAIEFFQVLPRDGLCSIVSSC